MEKHNLKHGLAQHYGSGTIYRHSLVRNMNYTEGVRFFAQNAGGGAYWLLDILVTEPKILQGVKDHGTCFVILNVEKNKAVLTVARDYMYGRDENGNDIDITFDTVVYSRNIDYTDCPDGVWKFYFTNNLIMLPSEY
jgi:hypothetical protein